MGQKMVLDFDLFIFALTTPMHYASFADSLFPLHIDVSLHTFFHYLNLQCIARATVTGFSTRLAGRTRVEEHTFLQNAQDSLTDAIQLQVV